MDEATTEQKSTERLLARAQAGEQDAVEELLRLHRAFLRQVIELRMDARLRGRVDPSDVVQEAQIEVVQRLDDFLERRPMPFRLWLRKTAHERLLKIRRHHRDAQRRTLNREVSLPDKSTWALAERLLAADSSPSERANKTEMARRLRAALMRLDEEDREILLMRNFEGLTNVEAAHVLGLDPATTSRRHGRALLQLRTILLDGGMTESQV